MSTILKIRKRKLIIISIIVLALLSITVWYFYSISASYEIKLVKGEEYNLWIAFQKYTFLLQPTGVRRSGEDEVKLTVTSGNNTQTRTIGFPSDSVGKTFKFLDLEVHIKEPLVDGLRIVVRKW